MSSIPISIIIITYMTDIYIYIIYISSGFRYTYCCKTRVSGNIRVFGGALYRRGGKQSRDFARDPAFAVDQWHLVD